ncbi:hypothetical protein QFZ67_006197 [Streptomyces sp. V1I1]|nr:hypothetical protein [Streptomyces sp. V1I1]
MTIKGAGVGLSDIVELLGFGSGALCVRLVARPRIATPAVYGWWTWTHGGGPGSDAALAAGVAGTLAPPIPEKR